MGEDDCIPSCNEVSYKITATTTAKFPGTGTGIETGTDADFTRAARNLLSNLTKNLNHRYKKYFFMTKMFWLFPKLFFFLQIGTIWLWSMFSFQKTLFSSTNEMNCMHLKISFVSFGNISIPVYIPKNTDYGWPMKPFHIEIQNFWAWADKLGR